MEKGNPKEKKKTKKKNKNRGRNRRTKWGGEWDSTAAEALSLNSGGRDKKEKSGGMADEGAESQRLLEGITGGEKQRLTAKKSRGPGAEGQTGRWSVQGGRGVCKKAAAWGFSPIQKRDAGGRET